MFRKLILALGATAALGAAALAPTSASAFPHGGHGWGHGHGHWGHHWRGPGFGFYAPTVVVGDTCYRIKRLVPTPRGMRWRRVTVCD